MREKLYRFKCPTGRNIRVEFMFMPGKWLSTGTMDHTEAVHFADKYLYEKLGISNAPKTLTLNEFAKDFFSQDGEYRKRQELKKKRYKDEYYKSHQGRLDNYILPEFGDRLISSITDISIDNWFVRLKKKDGTDLSDNSKNKLLYCFSAVMDEARRMGYIAENPVAKIDIITEEHIERLPITNEERDILFPKDDKALISIWGSVMWAGYFCVMKDTGFRPGEVAALFVKNVYRDLSGVYLENSIDYSTRKLQNSIKTTKKGQKYKIGILSDQTLRMLDLILPYNGFYFHTGKNLLRPETSNKHFKTVLEQQSISLNGRSQYSLRHSFETNIAGKVENKILMELMAHTSFRGEYDHRTPRDLLGQLQPMKELIEAF